MTRLTAGLHPDFDALSAHADRSDTEGVRTKVGRHVAGCGACRATVDELRALGAAARSSEVPATPAGLWARIERGIERSDAVASNAESVEREVAVRAASVSAPSAVTRATARKRSLVRRSVLGLVAIFALTATVLVLDSRDPLAAATPRRLTLDREYVVPGAPFTAHYRPIPSLAALPTVTVWARYRRADPEPLRSATGGMFVRAGVLKRVSALEYVGRIALPESAQVATYLVGDSVGRVLDVNPHSPLASATAIAADEAGRPRFLALVALLSSNEPHVDPQTRARAAEAMERFYPDEPETWILTEPLKHRGVIKDIVKLFESRERRYYGWHDKLEHRAGLSARTELLMANLGGYLEDSARANFWSARLLRDYPTSPASLGLWIARYRDVEGDSAAMVLRDFEPVYLAATAHASGAGSAQRIAENAVTRALTLATRSGDSALVHRWEARKRALLSPWFFGSGSDAWMHDANALVREERILREQLASAERDSVAPPTVWAAARLMARQNWGRRQRIRTLLAATQLVRGDAVGAKGVLDSLVLDVHSRGGCPLTETIRWRAEAERRLGQMSKARDDLAYLATTENWRVQLVGDSASTLLGESFDQEAWNQAKQTASEFHRGCFAAGRDRQKAEGW